MNIKSLFQNQKFKFILLVFILIICWYLGRRFDISFDQIKIFLNKFPLWLSGVVFVVLYVITTTFMWFGPKDVFRISAAFIFGAFISTIFVWIAEMIDAVIMFTLSRILGREYVEQKFKLKSDQAAKARKKTSVLEIFAWRINPLVPFRIMDLGFGITKVDFRKYFPMVMIASLPRIFWLQYIIATVGEGMFEAIKFKMKAMKEDKGNMINYIIEISDTMNSFFLDHPEILKFSVVYFLFIVVVTLFAFALRKFGKSHNPVNIA